MLSRFDVARTFRNANDKMAAEQILKDKIDVLIDLNGLTEGTRHGVMAWRPAPVQIAYLGFPGTVGGRFVDYIIGDDYTVPPGAEALYPEHVIRIPPTYQINDYQARWLPPRPKRRPADLPQGVPIVGMFNNVNKVGSQVWDTWIQIMREAPQAVLWMLEPGKVARGNLQRAMESAGVDTQRLVFAPKVKQEMHLARLQFCDMVLDPWPYGGHTTTGDALFAGLPVVALEGKNFASRVSGGLLRAAGLPNLVQPDIASYVQLAVSLINSPGEIAKLKRFIRKHKATMPVFDAQTRTRQLEAAYLAAHARAANGRPAEHLDVRINRAPARKKAGVAAPAVESIK
jgi:predicted O-linked N-acetylglucosamine transferase (SPINDLY family)